MRLAVNEKAAGLAARTKTLLSGVRPLLRNECGGMLTGGVKIVIVALVVVAIAVVLASFADSRTAGKLMAQAAGTDAAAPVGVKVIPWL